MGFSGGGSNITKPHTHDSTIVQDGGSLAPNVTQFGLTAGSILYSDGSNIQELGVGSASDTLTVNGAATAPEWAAAGGSVYELVGTTTALVTAPNGYDGLHLAFTAIDMTAVTELIAVVSATRDVNSTGFLWNGQTSGYSLGGSVTNNAGVGTAFGEASEAAFVIGHWASGTYQNFTVHFVLNEGEDKIACFGVGAFAGGQNSDVDTEIASISFVENGRNMPAGNHRLTVYKVSR
jgi:hypothetical protein